MNAVKWSLGWRAMAAAAMLALAACGGGNPDGDVSVPMKADTAAAFRGNGSWWNEKEPGSGLFIEAQGSTMVAAFFTYDRSGLPRWYTSSGPLAATGDGTFQYTAPLLYYSYSDGKLGSTVTGTVSLAFSGETAEVRIPGRTYTVTKFNREGRVQPRKAWQPQTGLWWNPARTGSGYTVDVADNQAAIGIFDYDSGGKPTWRLGIMPLKEPPEPFDVPFISYLDGQPFAGGYQAPRASDGGKVPIQFGEVCSALLHYSTPVTVSRLDFGALRDCPGYSSWPSGTGSTREYYDAVLQQKALQGYRYTRGYFRRESNTPITVELVDLNRSDTFAQREARFQAMGARGFRYVSHVDYPPRWGVFVKSETGSVFTYRLFPYLTKLPIPTPEAHVERLNAMGAEGFLHMYGNEYEEQVFMKDSNSKARYVYQALARPYTQAEFEEQIRTEGLKGFRLKGSTISGGVNWVGYEKDATQSSIFSYKLFTFADRTGSRTDQMAAQGYLYLGQGFQMADYFMYYRAINCTGILCEVHQQRW